MKTTSTTSSARRVGGYTVIELLVVIAAISILAMIAIPVIGMALKSAREANTVQLINHLADACDRYRQLRGYYPPQLQNLYSDFSGGTIADETGAPVQPLVDLPAERVSGGQVLDYFGRPLHYTLTGSSFLITSDGRDEMTGTPDDLYSRREGRL